MICLRVDKRHTSTGSIAFSPHSSGPLYFSRVEPWGPDDYSFRWDVGTIYETEDCIMRAYGNIFKPLIDYVPPYCKEDLNW